MGLEGPTSAKSIESICQEVYGDTKSFYRQIVTDCTDTGYQILLGPPFRETPILFIGYQPGKGSKSTEEERSYGSEDRWPSRCEYVTEEWRLAKNLQTMFPEELLEQCVGINAIFVRSYTVRQYEASVKYQVRTKIRDFCIPRVKTIAQAIGPKLIVIIGLGTLALFNEIRPEPILRSRSDRILARESILWGYRTIATLHLSGARVSREDRNAIAEKILQCVPCNHATVPNRS